MKNFLRIAFCFASSAVTAMVLIAVVHGLFRLDVLEILNQHRGASVGWIWTYRWKVQSDDGRVRISRTTNRSRLPVVDPHAQVGEWRLYLHPRHPEPKRTVVGLVKDFTIRFNYTHFRSDADGFATDNNLFAGNTLPSVSDPGGIVDTYDIWQITLPDWPLLTISGFYPMLCLRRYCLRLHRLRRNWCLGCGYDLRGMNIRCPECGLRNNQVAQALSSVLAGRVRGAVPIELKYMMTLAVDNIGAGEGGRRLTGSGSTQSKPTLPHSNDPESTASASEE